MYECGTVGLEESVGVLLGSLQVGCLTVQLVEVVEGLGLQVVVVAVVVLLVVVVVLLAVVVVLLVVVVVLLVVVVVLLVVVVVLLVVG